MPIISVDREVCAAGLLPVHAHRDPHACFVLNGAMVDRQWTGKPDPAVAGDLMVHSGGLSHEIEAGANGLTCIVVEWAPTFEASSLRYTCAEPLHDKLNLLSAALCTDNPARRVILKKEIASSIELAIKDREFEASPTWLHEIRAVIVQSMGDSCVSELAHHAGVHRATLTKHFRDAFGISPEQYKMLLKLECAADLLKSGSRLVSAAQGAGFSDQPHLNRVWRRYLGATPNQWLKGKATIVQDFSCAAMSD